MSVLKLDVLELYDLWLIMKIWWTHIYKQGDIPFEITIKFVYL